MKRVSHWLLAAAMLATFSPAALAAPKGGWDGVWAGAWGGSRPTSIRIENNKVVSFDYQGSTTPVSSSKVTATKVVYGDNGVTVTITKKSETTASATIHSDQGDASAELTRQ